MRSPVYHSSMHQLLIPVIAAVLIQAFRAVSVVMPSTGCYVLDNSSHIYDFTSWIGQSFLHGGTEEDLVVTFCKDVQTRSQKKGYVDFGRFDKFNNFHTGFGSINFVQEYYNGDLTNCEESFDKLGRTSQVNIICGDCPNGQCKGGLGCICNVTRESTCRVLVDLAIPCEKAGPRVYEGFTVGFHPREWEIVYNGMTQMGFEKAHPEFSFRTEQTRVALYMTAVASLSSLVQKPTIRVYPQEGLEVKLFGFGESGSPPTTLSPSVLIVDWRCLLARDAPYEIAVTIPIDNYEPIEFTLTKMCGYTQSEGGGATKGWAIFGILSCIFIVVSALFCCGGFVYKTRVEHQHGLYALPGMTYLSACLETVSGGFHHSYGRPEEVNSPFVNQARWVRDSGSSQGPGRQSEAKYGSI